MDIIDLAKQFIGNQQIQTIAEKNHIESDKAQDITNDALNLILTALKKNTDDEKGAHDLDKALSEDHDGSLLDQLDAYLEGNKPSGVADRTINGPGIVDHLFWQKKEQATDLLSKKTGVDKQKATEILIQLAPVALALLGKARNTTAKEENKEGGDLSGLLTGLIWGAVEKQKKNQKDENPIMDIAEQFLDKNNDGSILDDLLGMAMKKFGKKA